jgi:carbamoyl-phosphate synthase large subunit
LLDAFLEDAVELDVDAVSDGEVVLTGAVLEHVEEAGVHSGDSSCLTPPYSIGRETEARLRDITTRLARSLKVRGLLNVQYAVKGDSVFVLEANPRASRTVPFVSKAAGIPLVDLAVMAMLGGSLPIPVGEADEDASGVEPLISVKKPVLPFDRFPGEDTVLGPEMKSTGEVMGTGADFGEAYAKAQEGAGEPLPREGTVFLSVRDGDKRAIVFLAKRLVDLGFRLVATRGTARFLGLNGLRAEPIYKVGEGRPSVVELIEQGEVQLVLNTPRGQKSKYDERAIRLAAVARGVPCVTTIPGAIAAVCGIEASASGAFPVRALQDIRPAPEIPDFQPVSVP